MSQVSIKEFTDKEIEHRAAVLSIMFYDIPPEKLNLILQAINMLARTSTWPTITENKQKIPLPRERASLFACAGYQLGLGVNDSIRSFYLVNGHITLYGKVMKAIIRRSGLCKRLEVYWDDVNQRGVCVMRRKGDTHDSTTYFTKEQAIQANLWKKDVPMTKYGTPIPKPWVLYPEDMCGWRAFSRNAMNTFGDLFYGVQMTETVMDESTEIEQSKEEDLVDPKDKETEEILNKQSALTYQQTQALKMEIPEEATEGVEIKTDEKLHDIGFEEEK